MSLKLLAKNVHPFQRREFYPLLIDTFILMNTAMRILIQTITSAHNFEFVIGVYIKVSCTPLAFISPEFDSENVCPASPKV